MANMIESNPVTDHYAMGRTRVAVSSSFPSARSSRAPDFSHIELLPVDTQSSAY